MCLHKLGIPFFHFLISFFKKMKFTSSLYVVFLLKVQVIKTSDIFECVKLLNTEGRGFCLVS